MFDQYLLLSPFLHQDAPTSRPAGGGWVAIGVPRTLGLAFLNSLGISQFNDLPVIALALDAEAQTFLTATYSYSLVMNFRPQNDYRANIIAARQPMCVLVGEDDEVFYADQFSIVFEEAGNPVPVRILPEVGHIGLTLGPSAIRAVIATMECCGQQSHAVRHRDTLHVAHR